MEFAEPGREESLGAVMDLAGQSCETSPLLRRANPQVPVIKRKSAGPGPVHVRRDGRESDDESTDDDQDLDNQQQQDDPRDQIPSSRKHERLGALRYPRVKQPALQSTGLAQRKPRWPGISAATQAPSSTQALDTDDEDADVPRINARRNRSRASGEFGQALAQLSANGSLRRVAAYCTCDQIAVFKWMKWLDRVGNDPFAVAGAAAAPRFRLTGWQHKMYMGVLHSSFALPAAPLDEDRDDLDEAALLAKQRAMRKDVFYFASGCLVFWGLTSDEESLHLQAIASFCSGPVARVEVEDMVYRYGETSQVRSDAIVLGSDDVVEKLALSFAMGQSAKLDVFEERVEDRIRTTRQIPFNLSTLGSIKYSQTDISKLIGQLFIELADVNLHSDILDEPDFFWEDDAYEPLYTRMVKYMDVAKRVKILNTRLDILRELVSVLNQELIQHHGTKLEWIIIWLLVAEILISVGWNMLVKDILGFFNHG